MPRPDSWYPKIFENFENWEFPGKISIFSNLIFLRNDWKALSGMRGMKRHSTSPPCGNLVDGLPHDCHTETIAKLARLGPGLVVLKSWHFWSKFRKFRKLSKKLQIHRGSRSCSTSYPSGNQVDGSPLVAIPNRGELASPWPREDSW